MEHKKQKQSHQLQFKNNTKLNPSLFLNTKYRTHNQKHSKLHQLYNHKQITQDFQSQTMISTQSRIIIPTSHSIISIQRPTSNFQSEKKICQFRNYDHKRLH